MGRFYKIDTRGKHWLERVPTAPVWSAEDEGRILYDEGDEQVKFGNSVEWSNAGQYNDVPLNTILLIESDTALTGYTLLTNKDDMTVYVTKGSGAGGDAGGSDKTGGTWTTPLHTHSVATHTHTVGSHVHSVGSHVHSTSARTLSISQMPSHTHGISPDDCSGGGGDLEAGAGTFAFSTATGGSGSHTHGNTGAGTGNTGAPTGDTNTNAGGPGNTGNQPGQNSWRPRGRNFTRQQRT